MPKPASTTHPFRVMEEEAYHAFLEWPVWLALREKELAEHLAGRRSPRDLPVPADATPPTQYTTKTHR